MISTEKAFDMLPYVAELYEKLDIKTYLVKNSMTVSKDTPADEVSRIREAKGHELLVYLLKKAGSVKEEIFEIVAILEDTTADDIKARPFGETIKQLKTLLADTELMGFFKSAIQ